MITCDCGHKIFSPRSRAITCPKCKKELFVQGSNETKVDEVKPLHNLAKHWLAIHTYNPTPWNYKNAIAYYEEWLDAIPCSDCKLHWRSTTRFDPPKFSTSDEFFKYFVRKHNDVNEHVGHDYFPLYQAYNIYRPNMAAPCLYRSQEIGSVDCGCSSPEKVYNCNLHNIQCMLTAKVGSNVEYKDGTSSKFDGIQCQGCHEYSPLLEDFTDDWRYVKTEHLIQATRALAAKVPLPSAIIAMPTSGLIPATYLSTTLNVPLYLTLDDYVKQQVVNSSVRGNKRISGYARPLLVDDTIYVGNAFNKLKDTIESLPENSRPQRCAIYALPSSRHKVDYWGELLHCPHILEWNLFNSGIINGTYRNKSLRGGCAVDFDGVLCFDPPTVYDERLEKRIEKYEQWINQAIPRYPVRNRKIPLIVTWRVEKYRSQTEAWLEKHNIQYDKLVMWQGDAVSRTWHPSYKGDAYKNSSCSLFIESNAVQARQIFEYTGKPVLCLATGRIHK